MWAAALGAGLCLGYWALEALAWRRGSAVPFGAALGVALGGMVLRFALVLGVLILIGVFARPDFATAALAFLASFSVYVGRAPVHLSAPTRGGPSGGRPMSRKVKWGIFGFIASGRPGAARRAAGRRQVEEFSVAEEFTLHPIISLPSLAGVDLSVNKAVIYLWITTAVLVVLSIVVSRTIKKQPGRFQYTVEVLYELARDSIVGDVMKSGKATWFPYIGAVFFFVLASNLIGLLPLPLGEHWQPSYYAATANLYVTLTLALFTFVFTHYAGIRKNGFRYFANWAPPSAPPVLKQLIWVIHLVSEVFRLVSLSVRLFANMLAGHAILGVFFAMALIFQNYLAALLLAGRLRAHLPVRDLRGLHPGLHLRHPLRRVHRRGAGPGALTRAPGSPQSCKRWTREPSRRILNGR